jgi:hypothetical protein
MEYWIVCAPGGSGLKGAVSRLVDGLRAQFGEIEHQDVEEVLCNSAKTKSELQSMGVSLSGAPDMYDVTYNLQRDQVIEAWGEALAQALSNLQQSTAERKLLSCHLTLYGGRRREFYSPVDVSLFASEHRPTHLLLLMDDSLDMFARLRKARYLYTEARQIQDYVRSVERDEDVEVGALESVRPKLVLEWRVGTLSSLLAWRHTEMIIAESLARQTKAKYLAFGVKQSLSAAGRWLIDGNPTTAYLSHPISRPRRQWIESRTWPESVSQFNQLQTSLLAFGVVCVMPTAIDELRFRRGTQTPISKLEPELNARWPVPTDSVNYEDTLYMIEEGGPEHENLIAPESNEDFDPDPLLRSFEGQVKSEIAFRDHHLVANCPHLLVFRPLYVDGSFSGGVSAEIEHWNLHASLDKGSDRRAVFLHFTDDVQAMISRDPDAVKARILEIAKQNLEGAGWSSAIAAEIVRNAEGGHSLTNILDAGVIPPGRQDEIQERWPELQHIAEVQAFREKLTGVGLPISQVGIWLVEDSQAMTGSLQEVASFLRLEGEPPSHWEQMIPQLVPQE